MTVLPYIPVKGAAAFPQNLFSDSELKKASRVLEIAQNWVQRFDQAETGDEFADLFVDEGYWRDLVAFTNDYRSIAKVNIRQAAENTLPRIKKSGARLTNDLEPTVEKPFPDLVFIQAKFEFSSAVGPSFGIVKIVKSEDGVYRAFVLLTVLDGINGITEKVGSTRTTGVHNGAISYSQERTSALEHPKPSVIIVGGGHNGLEVATRLKALGVSSLIVDRRERIGDSWRERYSSLSLHDSVWVSHLPYMPFPATWPVFCPAGKLGNWLEYYAEVMELTTWTSAHIVPESTCYDPAKDSWSVTVKRGDNLHVFDGIKSIVMATGLAGGFAKVPPPFPNQNVFKGVIIHSSEYKSGAAWKGKQAVVVGACTSAHDLSMDLLNNEAKVTMLQRSPTYIMSVKNGSSRLIKDLYYEGGPDTQLADQLVEASPKAVLKTYLQRIIPEIAQSDKELLDGLEKVGFKTTLGPDNTGHTFLSAEKNGGFYFDTGASGRIAKGDIAVEQSEIDHFTENSVVLKNGRILHPDLVIFATGFTGFKDSVAETLGQKYADTMGDIWGLDEEGELKGIFRSTGTGIPKCYFMVGSLAMSRYNSKLIALQIAGEQRGVLKERYTIEAQKASA